MDTEERSISYSRVLRRVAPWLIIVASAALGYRSVLPPRPVAATAPADQFSAERAFEHVNVIADEPHPMGTPANAEVRAYIVTELESSGVTVELQTTMAQDYFGTDELVPVVNVIGLIPGSASTGIVTLVAHYDTVPATAGANDNTAAVSALLETGRAVQAGRPLQNDVMLLFTDAEEPAPHYGVTEFVGQHQSVADIALVVNFEANGGSGASLLAETSGPQRWLIDELAAADGRPAAYSFLTELGRLLGDIGTDFDVFRNAGVPGFNFAYLRGSPIYHTPADNLAAVNWGSLQHHGAHALSITRHFGTIDLDTPQPDSAVVFFAIEPLFVRYPAGWAIPVALVALAVGIAASLRYDVRSTRIAVGMVTTAGVGLVATIVGTILWLLIVAVRPTPGVAESYLYFGCIVAVVTIIFRRVLTRAVGSATAPALLLWWALFACLTAFFLPGFSYLFSWPALFAGLALLWMTYRSGRPGWASFTLVVAVTLLLTVPAIDLFFHFAEPRPGNPDSSVPAVAAIPILLFLLAAGLLRPVWPTGSINESEVPPRRQQHPTMSPK